MARKGKRGNTSRTKKHSRKLPKTIRGRKFKPHTKRRIKSSKRKKKGDLLVTSNGRTWVFWDINNPRDKRAMKGAAEKAFAMQFPIERVAALAKKAFKKFKVKQIHLWAASGVVGQAFVDLQAFIDWVDEKWSAGRYVNDKGYSSDPEQWINGIAILIKE